MAAAQGADDRDVEFTMANPSESEMRTYAEQAARYCQEFARESNRASVILGVARLDELLRQLLKRVLSPASGPKNDSLLRPDGPLGTFGARIMACERLGLIDMGIASSLRLIKAIRNDFAHVSEPQNLTGC